MEIRPANLSDRDDVSVAEITAGGPYRGDVTRLQSCEHIDGIDSAEMTANAHLIAAAPDLYAAAQGILDQCDAILLPDDDETAALRAALAKARGQA